MSKVVKSNKVTVKGVLNISEDNLIKIDIGDDGEDLVDVAAQIQYLNGTEVTLTVSQNTEIAWLELRIYGN